MNIQNDPAANQDQLRTGAASLPEAQTENRFGLHHGEKIEVSGQQYKIIVLPESDLSFKCPENHPDCEAYCAAIAALKPCAAIVQDLSDRLLDPSDGRTLRGAEHLIEVSSLLPAGFAEKIGPYLLTVIKNGSLLHSTRGSIIAPPCPRQEMEQALASLPDRGFDRQGWLDSIYDPTPLVTEGFYLFETPEDRSRFEASLGSDYAAAKAAVRDLFDRAVSGGLGKDEWSEYDRQSQKMLEIQKNALQAPLAASEASQEMTTRPRISVARDGTITLASRHYAQDFSAELDELARHLDLAKVLLPSGAAELREVLEAQAAWCRDRSYGPDWGESRPRWIAAGDASNLIDLNLTCEEKVSHLGAKSVFQFVLTQHVDIPQTLAQPWDAVRRAGAAANVNTLMLDMMEVGGFASNHIIAGEKLPDPAGRPQYKSMTFRNTTQALMIEAQAEAVAAATGMSVDEALAMKDIPVLAVALHEYGHTLGDHAEFLGEHGGSVEETNAQGSAIYLTARLAPSELDKVQRFETCWMPVRRVRQGPTEAHSRSDIALFEEYLKAGGHRD